MNNMKNSRWFITFLAFCGLIICILDRSALSFAIKDIEHELHINNAEFGLLSSAFGVGYMIMVSIGGFIVTKFGSRHIWSITAIIWSIATLLLGLSSGLIILFILRLITGLAEGPTGPSIMRVVLDWLPKHERARALSAIIAANPFSSVIGAPLCSYLILQYNWKVMFFVLGVAGIIWGILWFKLYRNSPVQSSFTTKEECNLILNNSDSHDDISNTKHSIKDVLTSKTLMFNNYSFFAFGYLLFFAISWLPGYLMQTYNYSLKELGTLLIIPWLAASIMMLIIGVLSDRLYHITRSLKLSRTMLTGICQIIAAICFLPIIHSNNMTIIITFLSLAIGFGLAPSSCLYAINSDIGKRLGPIGTGIMVACLAFAGIIAPIITGFLSQISGNFISAIYVMLFINITAGIFIISIPKPDKEVRELHS